MLYSQTLGLLQLAYNIEADRLASNLSMQQPVLAQASGSHAHNVTDLGRELFNTPRLQPVEVANGFQTPPRTCDMPSTPCAPRQGKPPPLMMALAANDIMQVRACLSVNSSVASILFWDHNVDTPLCTAVRLRCDTCIVKALLDSDADPEAIGVHGRTPLMIAASLCSELPEPDPLSILCPALTEDQLRRARATMELLMEKAVGPCSTDLTQRIGATTK